MKNTNTKSRYLLSIAGQASFVILAALFLSTALYAQSTLFSFQATLSNEVTPATDIFEMEFKLYDAAANGTQIGVTNLVPAVDVKNRTFTVWLDFGAAAFPGADRFIEISYRRKRSDSFNTVAARWQILSVPYAIRALNATTADTALNITGFDPGDFVQTTDPRLSDERNPLPGSNNYIQNTTAQQSSADFNISGNGTANVFNVATQYNIGGNRILGNAGGNNVFAGVGAGAVNAGSENSFFGRNAGFSNATGSINSFFGNSAGSRNTTGSGNSIFGAFAGNFNSTGESNSFFGLDAGNSNTSGSNNAFFGAGAGRGNTTSNFNAFFGTNAGSSNSTGNNNAFFGTSAGFNNSTGQFNVFFGEGTGTGNTTGSGNTFIGRDADFASPGATGNNNTLLGLNTRVVSGVNNSTAIGVNATVSTSDTIVLGTRVQITEIQGITKMTSRQNGASQDFAAETFPISANGDGRDGGLVANTLVFRFFDGGPSSSPVCFRPKSLPTTAGGYVLTNCSSDVFSSLANKTDMKPFSDGLDVINRLKPIAFRWKDGGGSDFGFNAEDVAEIAPNLVKRNEKGEANDVNKNVLNVLFINAFKEQQAQIKAQQVQIEQQQQQIDALKQLVCQINQQAEACKQKEERKEAQSRKFDGKFRIQTGEKK